MANLIYDSALEDEARGAIDYDTDTFKIMLVTSSYTPNKGTHTRRSDVTNEVTGTGYTAGGVTSVCTVAKDTTNHKVTLTFAGVSWANITITQLRGAVIYKSTGTAANDPLVGYIDFVTDQTRSNSLLSIAASVIPKQNS